ncbi:MAG: glycosyltransferase family 2 protein [Lachnospiraceae bacterium]|nr:glycosyltransferase family 2 protein [Lachnospiraceae bacterium]
MKINRYQIQKAVRYLKHYGLKEFFIRLAEKSEPEHISYESVYKKQMVGAAELRRQRRESDRWLGRPMFSCIAAGNQDIWQERLKRQSYRNWELCMADEGFQRAAASAAGSYFVLLASDDVPAPDALYRLAETIVFPEQIVQSGVHWESGMTPDIIYTDEDMLTEEGEGYEYPLFKPDYSPDLLEQYCYMRHLFCVSRELALETAEQEKSPVYSADDRDMDCFVRACAARAGSIVHIPRVLCHRAHRALKEQMPPDRPVLVNTCGTDFSEEQPLVSILIPNKDERSALEKCLASIARSTYRNYEIIIIENNSESQEIFDYYGRIQEENPRIRVCRWGGRGFNYSAINNFGEVQANGEYLVFLNNDIELLTPDWMEQMLNSCIRSGVAAVGGKLYYPDDTVQHAGIVVGIGGHARGVAANMCVGLARNDPGYMGRAVLKQNMSAVTAACMMMKRSVFREIGGFTEKLAVAFNDVDLCLKARKAGYLIVFDPKVEAYHYESKSRGMEDTEEKVYRFQQEIEYMREQWNDILRYGDPYYNPNLTLHRTDYSLRNP